MPELELRYAEEEIRELVRKDAESRLDQGVADDQVESDHQYGWIVTLKSFE